MTEMLGIEIMERSVCHSDWPETIHKTKDPFVKRHDEAPAAGWKADCPWLWMSLTAHSPSSGEISELKLHVNAFYTISCYLAFHVQPCQMTSSPPDWRTHHPTDDRD